MFKPVILHDEPIERTHGVQDTPETFLRMHLQASVKKLRLRKQLIKLTKDPPNLEAFRSLFTN